MRCRWALLLGLLPVVLAGCLTGNPTRSTFWVERSSLFHFPSGPDVVVMYVALLEQPVGDRYINHDLWEQADEQAAHTERRALLAANGFRVAQLGGILPSRLHTLLTSERSCINPYRSHIHEGHASVVKLRPEMPQCSFDLHVGAEDKSITLDQALCTLVVTPTLTRDGKTRLRFTPQVQHGETVMMPRPATDPNGVYTWSLREQRPTEVYDDLSWEVTLAPNEFVVVGARHDQPNTLGWQSFVCRDLSRPKQYLLAIRTGRPTACVDTASSVSDDEDTSGTPTPAFQASSTTAVNIDNK